MEASFTMSVGTFAGRVSAAQHRTVQNMLTNGPGSSPDDEELLIRRPVVVLRGIWAGYPPATRHLATNSTWQHSIDQENVYRWVLKAWAKKARNRQTQHSPGGLLSLMEPCEDNKYRAWGNVTKKKFSLQPPSSHVAHEDPFGGEVELAQ